MHLADTPGVIITQAGNPSIVVGRNFRGEETLPVELPARNFWEKMFVEKDHIVEHSNEDKERMAHLLQSLRNQMQSDDCVREMLDRLQSTIFKEGASCAPGEWVGKARRSFGSLTQESLSAFGGASSAASSAGDINEDISITNARTDFRVSGAKVLRAFSIKHAHVNQLERIADALGMDHKDVVLTKAADIMKRAREKNEELKKLVAQIDGWTDESFLANYTTGKQCVIALIELEKACISCCDTLKKVRLANVRQAAGDRRRDGLTFRKALGNGTVTAQGFPKSMMAFLGTICKCNDGVDNISPDSKNVIMIDDGEVVLDLGNVMCENGGVKLGGTGLVEAITEDGLQVRIAKINEYYADNTDSMLS